MNTPADTHGSLSPAGKSAQGDRDRVCLPCDLPERGDPQMGNGPGSCTLPPVRSWGQTWRRLEDSIVGDLIGGIALFGIIYMLWIFAWVFAQ